MFFRRFPSGTRMPVSSLLGLAGVAVVCLALSLVVLDSDDARRIAAIAGGVGGAMAVLIAGALIRRHFRRMERLRGAVIVALAHAARHVVYSQDAPASDEVGRLHEAIDALVVERLALRREINQRLEAVLASVTEAVLVVTDTGLVSLVNAGARNLLGAGKVAVGTSVFAALRRTDWEQAVSAARSSGTLLYNM